MIMKTKKMFFCLLIAALLPLYGHAEIPIEIYSPLRDIKVSGDINSGGFAWATVENTGSISRNITLRMRIEQNEQIAAISSVSKVISPGGEKTFNIKAPVTTANSKLYISAEYGRPAAELYVSQTGDDRNDGSFEFPLATLEGAKKEVRRIKYSTGLSEGGITVYIRGGEYTFNTSMYLSGADSGYENAPVTYTAYNGEEVKIKGSKPIVNQSFTSAGLANSNILKADLRASGIYDFGEIVAINSFNLDSDTPSSTMLYENGDIQTIARYPNKDINGNDVYLKIGNVMGSGDSSRIFNHNITAFNPSVKWSGEEIWTRGFFRYYWYEDVKRATVTNTQVTLNETTAFGVLKDQEYYFFNILAELDKENEFFIDKSSGYLYYYPDGSINNKKLELSFLKTPIFVMNNTKNVYISGISFINSRFNGITMNNCENVLIEGCKFTGLGGQAVKITGGENCGVLSSDIHSVGRGGVRLEGGDRISLTPAKHYVENCDIYDFSIETATYNPAVYLSGVGSYVRNNKLHSGPHIGMAVSGNDHIIEYNEIYDLCKNSHDGGAVYGGRDWTQCGNLIRNNYFHDIQGKQNVARPEAHAVYFDDMMSGNEVTDNVFYNVFNGVMLHGSRSTTITGNIFANMGTYSVHQTNIIREQNPDSYDSELRVNYRKIFTEFAEHQMAAPKNGIWAKYNGQPIDGHPNYRRLDKIPYDQPSYPKYNVISDNFLYNAPAISIAASAYTTRAAESGSFENNIVISTFDLTAETSGMGTYTDKWRPVR